MKSLMKATCTILGAVLIAFPMTLVAAPDAAQQAATQKMHQAKRELAAAQAASGAERQRMMDSHMKLMSEVMGQMQKAKPAKDMSPEKMREWIDEHMKLMNEMMGQMMDEHHLMIQCNNPAKKSGMAAPART
jgi:hypothetical protein